MKEWNKAFSQYEGKLDVKSQNKENNKKLAVFPNKNTSKVPHCDKQKKRKSSATKKRKYLMHSTKR